MGKFRGTNQKAAAAAEKKLADQKAKDAAAAAVAEKQASVEWSKGANLRGIQKSEAAALKADEQARKRRDKATLLAEEEANTGSSKPKKASTLSKKGKKKKNNDLSLLEDALVGAADKKVRSNRAAERQKAEKQKAEEVRKQAEQKPIDPLLANTQSMIDGTDGKFVGRAANKALEMEGAGGIDNALGALDVSGPATSEPTRKALYKAFEERKMAELKSELPGLKMSQYKDKIFNLWKKSPENPKNQE